MAFVKTQRVEKSEVVSPKDHKMIRGELRKVAAQSVSQLTEEQKRQLTNRLDK